MKTDAKNVNALCHAYDLGKNAGISETLDLLKGIILDLDRCNHYDLYNELMYQSVKVDDVIEVIEQINEQWRGRRNELVPK